MSRHSREIREQRKQVAAPPSSTFQITAQAMRFSGPLPPPEILARYNDAVPNGAERILAMAESQSRHRQELEKNVVEAGCRAQRNGTIFGFLICLAAIGSGTYLIAMGKSAQGLVPIIGALGGLVTVFVLGRHQQRKDLEQKAATLALPHQSPSSN